ncbi:ABC transporter permease subunit [Leucobacter sp. gxy201]|uniref:ABC transporter permease n=1 Tax=Leucobacter sp. gxy201 TaxID=2957200 RepID=UPI003D9FFA79
MSGRGESRPVMTGRAPDRLAVSRPGFWRGLRLIAALELRQRMRSRALLVLAIVWFVIIGAVTLLAWATLSAMLGAAGAETDGYPLFSLIVAFVLLFGTLVAPAISAGSIGAERGQATLATTQVTLIGLWQILLGKALAAWITGIAFLVIAAPFVVFSLLLSGTGAAQLCLALVALALQIGVFTAIGVGLSAMIRSQVFAIVMAYLMVALLSVGTLIGFALASGVTTSYHEVENRAFTSEYYAATAECTDEACWQAVPEECETRIDRVPYVPTDRLWWILALNPYVVVADMVPPQLDRYRTPNDLFGGIAYTVRSLQQAPAAPTGWNDCAPENRVPLEVDPTDEVFESTVPVWWIGFGLQLLLVAGALWGGYRRLDTPAKRLPRGSRIA